jgi:hypothetical protein
MTITLLASTRPLSKQAAVTSPQLRCTHPCLATPHTFFVMAYDFILCFTPTGQRSSPSAYVSSSHPRSMPCLIHHLLTTHPSLTYASPIPYLRLTHYLPTPHPSLTNASTITYLRVTHHLLTPHPALTIPLCPTRSLF